MSAPLPSLPARQVSSLVDEFPKARVVVFVPRLQLGTALQQAVARTRGHASGLQATTVEDYARNLAALSLRVDGGTELDAGSRFFLTEQAIRTLTDKQQSALTGGQSLSGLIAPLARTFATLRTHNVSPETYRQQATESPQQRAQADAFSQYEALLNQRALFDTADLFDRARILAESPGRDLSSTVWAIEDTVVLSTVERQFVDTLREAGPKEPGLYRIGPVLSEETESSSPPSRSAAAHFPEAPCPDPESATPSPVGSLSLTPARRLTADDAQRLRFLTATGTRREVQAVLEDILAEEHPLDTVEIAYTSPDPYLPLIDTLAERYDIPVSLSGGRSLTATRPGQLLRGFYEWIVNGCPISDLIGLLRAGLLRLDVTPGDNEKPLDSRHAATLLAEKRYPDDCRNYESTFESWCAVLESEAEEINARTDRSWTTQTIRRRREKRDAVRAVQKGVKKLLSLAHMNDRTSLTPSDLARGSEKLLEKHGTTSAPTDPEEERTPDQAARNRLLERLQAVQDMDGSTTFSPPQLAQRMATWLGLSPYVQAQRPRPGRAHVVPLESAGFANRDHLYVLGLDAASAQTAVPDDPLLDDADRAALSDDSRSLPLRQTQADVEAWRIRQALARHEGPVTFSASTYDLTEDEDLFEAPLYLRLKEAAQSARGVDGTADDPLVEHHALASEANTLLSRLDRWTGRNRPAQNTREAARASYPWIQRGLDAAAARDSDSYTQHDGLLAPSSHPDLDPFSGPRPVSAGQLETYAQAPYAYFLRHVLEIEPLDEPALDDVAWLDARGRGALLHHTFQRFMAKLNRQPTREDVDMLREVFEKALQDRREQLPPPSEVVYASTRRQLWNDTRLFLRAEAARTDPHRPHAFEVGFGYPPHRRTDGDYDTAPTLHLGNLTFSLRGRIDRIDRLDDDTVGLWDYKTGSSRKYDEGDLVTGDFHLQWALYAYAYEALANETVATAGYFFTSTDEMGKRISASAKAHRQSVARVLQKISDGITGGAFPITDADALRYSYAPLFHDYRERRKQVNSKDWPDDRPAPPGFDSD